MSEDEKLPDKIQRMTDVGKIAANVLDKLVNFAEVGMPTIEVDREAERLYKELDVESLSKGYGKGRNGKPFPGNICIWTEDVVTHGFGTEENVLQDGDLVSIDVAIRKNGYCADNARSFILGRTSPAKEKILSVTKEALNRAINAAKVGNTVGDIGYAVQSYVEKQGFSVVKEMVGHTIGTEMHEEPMIPCYGLPGRGQKLEKYHTIAMDILINEASPNITISKEDGWTVRTVDGKLSCIMEDTFYVGNEGGVLLTKKD